MQFNLTNIMTKFKLALCLLLVTFGLAATVPANAALPQNVTVTGTVVDVNGDPVIGASVVQDGTLNGTVTDLDGKYSLTVPANSKIAFSFIGYATQVLDVNGRTRVDVTLLEDTELLEDVVVVGFGTQTKANLTGAVTSIDSKVLNDRPLTDLNHGLQGVSPGLQILYSSGSLSASPTIRVRGVGSYSGGSEQGSPLILVDGVQSSLSYVNPDDVESISVLKDAASASIYGARAAFGVVLITTKKGTTDKLKVDLTASFGFSNPGKMLQHADAATALSTMVDYGYTIGQAPESWAMLHSVTLAGLEVWKQKYAASRDPYDLNIIYGEDYANVGSSTYFYREWDVEKIMFGRNVPTQNYNLRLSGRLGNSSNVNASFGYTNKTGVYKYNPQKSSRYNFNMNFQTTVTPWLTANLGIMASRNVVKETNAYGYSNAFSEVYRYGTWAPYGEIDGVGIGYPAVYHRYSAYGTNNTDNLRLTARLIAKPIKDLTLTAEYSINATYGHRYTPGGQLKLWKYQRAMIDPVNGEPVNVDEALPNTSGDAVTYNSSRSQRQVFNTYADYTHKWGGHNFAAKVGANIEWSENWSNSSERRGLYDPAHAELSLAYGDQYVGGSHGHSAIAGFFARLNYDYKGRYLVELNGRYDGSSSFPTNSQWGFFPSGSLGWRVSEEPWMQGAKNVINNLKFRFSAGTIGNASVGGNAFERTMSISNASWNINTGIIRAAGLPQTVSTTLTWERVTTYDAGVDLGLFRMFDITFDWYKRVTDDMLGTGEAIPKTSGTSAPKTNSGQLTTTGWEFQINFNKVINKNLSVFASAGLSDSKSVVTKWSSAGVINSMYEGQTIGEIWGLTTDRMLTPDDMEKVDGDWKMKSTLPDQSKLVSGSYFGSFQAGDLLFKDLDGNNKIDGGTGVIGDTGDLTIIGNSMPHYEYNFRFGGNFYGFDLSVFFQGVGKRDLNGTGSNPFMPLANSSFDVMYAHQFDFYRGPRYPGQVEGDGTNGTYSTYGLGANTENPYFPRLVLHSGSSTITGLSGCNNNVTQTRYLINLAYCRLKNITLGYTIPKAVTQKVNIDKIRVYVTGENLLTFQDNKLPIDPETTGGGTIGRTFPMQKTVSFGLQVSF